MTSADPDALLAPLLRARRFDEQLMAHADQIRGHYHVSVGMEGTAVALAACRRDGDTVSTTYRNHAHLAAMGSDLETMFGEVLGRDVGHQRGRGGSIHLSDPDLGVLHTSAMVSGGVPQALGLAYGRARTHPEASCFCIFGDGAMGEGAVHESLNLASLWSLPVVFVCENNAPPADGQASAMQAAPSFLAIAELHRTPGEVVDARHPALVVEAMGRLAAETRQGGGPRFLEARAAAWEGNQSFFPHDATGPTDVADAARGHDDPWRSDDDPVLNECRRLLEAGVSMTELAEVDRRVSAEVGAAFAAAERAPVADPGAALTDVVADR